MNQTIFVKVDNQNFVSDFVRQPTAGYSEVTVPLAWLSNFMQFSDKFSFVDGVLHAPGDLPTVTAAEVQQQLVEAQEQIDSQAATIATQAQQLDTAQRTITQLQQMAGVTTGQLAKLSLSANTDK